MVSSRISAPDARILARSRRVQVTWTGLTTPACRRGHAFAEGGSPVCCRHAIRQCTVNQCAVLVRPKGLARAVWSTSWDIHSRSNDL